MKNNHTDITIVLDRSGSMLSVASDTIGGFNRFLQDQKSAPGSATITLHQFDHEFQTVIASANINTAEYLTEKTFIPRGNTALFDAIGRSVVDTGNRLARSPEKDRAGKVVFVILTDGEENASTGYTEEKIFEMIKHQREKYSWEFVFLGANQDAIKTAKSVGINTSNALNYASNSAGVQCGFDATAFNLRAFRSGQNANMAYTASQHADQAMAGAKQSSTPIK